MSRVNSQWFSRKDVEKGLHLKFISNLDAISKELENSYFEILMTQDGEGAYCVEWVERSYDSDDFGGRFKYLEYDDIIMKEIKFPDNHYEYLLPEDVDETFNDWLKEHPNYKKNQYGIWYDENEQKAWEEQLKHNGIEGTSDTTITAKQMSLEDFGIKIE